MKYYYSKSKFSSQLFYKKVQKASLEHLSGHFNVSVIPHFYYIGKYHIHSVVEKDNNRTVYLTMKSMDETVNFDDLNRINKFFVSLSHNGKKAMIFNHDLEGIILKS